MSRICRVYYKLKKMEVNMYTLLQLTQSPVYFSGRGKFCLWTKWVKLEALTRDVLLHLIKHHFYTSVYVKRKNWVCSNKWKVPAAMMVRCAQPTFLLVLITLDCSSVHVVLLNNQTPLLLKFYSQGKNVLSTAVQMLVTSLLLRDLLVKGQNVTKKTPVLIITCLVTAHIQ